MTRFERGQTQILYRYLPGAIFEHDRYGLCRVDRVVVDRPNRINELALFEALSEALQAWHRAGIPPEFPDPRDENKRRQYRIGRPGEVLFSPFPLTFQCQECGHVFRPHRTDPFDGRCPRKSCRGRLVQLRYVEAHNCGRLEEIHLPDRGCPQHGRSYLRFFDPGRVQLARWVCGVCEREIQKPRMTPCECSYTERIRRSGSDRQRYERFLRMYPVTEPGLYIPHVTAFVNFDQSEEQRFSTDPDSHALLLARCWGVLAGPVPRVLKERGRGVLENPNIKAAIEALREHDPRKAEELERKIASPPGQEAVLRVRDLVPRDLLSGVPPRRLVEHVLLMDSDRHRLSLASSSGKVRREELERLGFWEVVHVDDFPVAMLAFGYSRIFRDPRRAVLNPFPPDEEGRFPLLVLPTETEGLWFHLDPRRVLGWLIQNHMASGSMPESQEEAWARLYREVLAEGFRVDRDLSWAAQGILYLLHSISHVLLQRIEWSGFSPQSLGEYFIPETLSFILFVNRFDGSRIGGLATLFELRLAEWLQDSVQGGRCCIYDPICAESGASCAGCLHREHNCPYFNRYLSRSVLYGGPVEWEGLGSGEIRCGYWADG
jgi:hypothetical protein